MAVTVSWIKHRDTELDLSPKAIVICGSVAESARMTDKQIAPTFWHVTVKRVSTGLGVATDVVAIAVLYTESGDLPPGPAFEMLWTQVIAEKLPPLTFATHEIKPYVGVKRSDLPERPDWRGVSFIGWVKMMNPEVWEKLPH